MHLTLPIILTLLTTTALALPTTSNATLPTNAHNATLSTLHKRNKAGWVGSFSNSACIGPVAPNVVPNVQTGICHKFTPQKGMAWVGVNYGSGDDQLQDVTFFVDDGCKYIIDGPGVGGFGVAGYDTQSTSGKGMTCSNLLGSAKSFKSEG